MKRQSIGIVTGCALLLLVTVCSFYKGPVQVHRGINTIIVDAGHGGKDDGAAGSYSLEKNLTLAIAMKVGKTLQTALPGVHVVMTRTTDIFQPVGEKAQIANDNKGDLFVCIHCNLRVNIVKRFVGYKKEAYYTGHGSARKKHYHKVAIYHKYEVNDPDIKGTETYIFTARKEDSKIQAYLDGEAAEDTTDTPIQETPEDRIMAMSWAKNYFFKSFKLASMIQDEFTPLDRNRGVMQRYTGIRVLESTNMPAVLVETGYLSNKEDEDYLNSDAGQQQIADAITRAVVKYKEEAEGKVPPTPVDTSKVGNKNP